MMTKEDVSIQKSILKITMKRRITATEELQTKSYLKKMQMAV
ncbi:hypothetical protein MKZ01_13995 [Lysinibacillus endophyticus]